MSDEKRTPQSTSSQGADTDEPSALHREAKRVEHLQSKDGGHDEEAELEKSEKVLQVGQDAKVQAVKREAKETGAGSHEPQESLNQDG